MSYAGHNEDPQVLHASNVTELLTESGVDLLLDVSAELDAGLHEGMKATCIVANPGSLPLSRLMSCEVILKNS